MNPDPPSPKLKKIGAATSSSREVRSWPWASSPVKCATMPPAGDSIATPTRWPTSSSSAAGVSSSVMPRTSWRACRSARARLGAQSALGPPMDASRCPRRRMKRQKSPLGSTVDRLHARRSRRADQIAGG
jgi:hypothetical protein